MTRLPHPECNVPQEPSPIYIDPRGVKADDGTEWVYMTKPDWGKLGGYVFNAQSWIRSAGPCIRAHGSDVPNPPGGVKQ